MNKTLLRKVQKVVAQSPHSCDMSAWTCGSTACIGGWAMRLAGLVKQTQWTDKGKRAAKRYTYPNVYDLRIGTGPAEDNCDISVEKVAGQVLKLNDDQIGNLFYEYNWPEPYKNLYKNAKPAQRGLIAAARIEHLIQTGQ